MQIFRIVNNFTVHKRTMPHVTPAQLAKMAEVIGANGAIELHLTVDGYANDPRDLWDIAEVRTWAADFINECPRILRYCTKDTARLLGAMCCEVTGQPPYLKVTLDPNGAFVRACVEAGIEPLKDADA